MRFHLLDRIDEYEPGRRVRARKLVSAAEDYLEPVDGQQVLPAPLMLEALCQAGTWLIMLSSERRRRAALLQIGGFRYVGVAVAGDVLELDGVVESMGADVAVLSGTVSVAGTPVAEATDIMCALMDADLLEDPDDSARMLDALTRT